jgi:hypothetical protein
VGRLSNAARAAWGELRKAAPAPDAGRLISATQNLGSSASMVGLSTGNSGLTGFGLSTPSPAQEQALREQGMQTGGAFSPGRPIQQFFPQGMPPRKHDFPAGYNVGARPRANERGRPSFDTLKAIIDAWDVSRLCIDHIKRDVRSFDWRIVPKEGVEDDVSDQIAAARKFWSRPDRTHYFDSWLALLLEDMLRFDAPVIYRSRTRGGQLGALDPVAGPTIAPLLDYYGRRPYGEAPAYVQFVAGVPALWLTESSVIYEPFMPLPESPYGLPPMEWLLLTGNTDLRFQWHFLQAFTEGALPDTFMEAPPDQSDPEEIVKFQAAWDVVMEGDQSQLHKVKWIPAGSKPMFHPQKVFDEKFPIYLTRKTASAFGITPHDLGIVQDVNRSTGETQVDVQFRIGTQPILKWATGIATRVTNEDLGLADVDFEFDTGGEKEDRLAEAQAHQLYVFMGAESPDEVRQDVLGKEIDPEHPVPRFVFSPRAGAIPLKSIEEIAGAIDPNTAGPEAGSVEPAADLTPGEYTAPTGVVAQKEDLRSKRQAAVQPPAAPQIAGQQSEDTASGLGGAGGGVAKALDRWRLNAGQRVHQGLQPRRFRGEWAQAAGVDVPREQLAAIWTRLEKAQSAEEVDAAFRFPFLRKALEDRPLHPQLLAAEEHYADAVRDLFAEALDPDAVAAAWLAAQPVAKAGAATVSADLRTFAAEFLRSRLHLDLNGLAALLRALYQDGWRLGVGAALTALRGGGLPASSSDPATDIDWSAWTPGNPAAAEQALGLAELLQEAGVVIQGISDTTLDRLAEILAQGASSGDSVDAIARGLADLLGDGDRALVIAQTELARATSAASLETYAFNGIGGKGWMTFNPCPICARNEAAGVIPLSASFPGGASAPPQHPRCRCSLYPSPLPGQEV